MEGISSMVRRKNQGKGQALVIRVEAPTRLVSGGADGGTRGGVG